MIKEEIKNNLNRKIIGATSEIIRCKKLDETVEKNLSAGLENDLEFFTISDQIDEKRATIVSLYNEYINQQLGLDDGGVLMNETNTEKTVVVDSNIKIEAESEKKLEFSVKSLVKKFFSIFK